MTTNAGLEGEGARYALLRRLAPAMRHHLVVNLQPIGMIYDVMERRLQSPAPNLVQIKESAAKINGFSRAAVRSCLDVMTWLSPEEGATSTVAEGVAECMGLLASGLNFRGFTVTDAGNAPDLAVSRPAIRSVLAGAMLAATDALPHAADLSIRADASADGAVVRIDWAAAPGRDGVSVDGGYRALRWADVEAIAREESVRVLHADAAVRLVFPPVTPAVPLTVD